MDLLVFAILSAIAHAIFQKRYQFDMYSYLMPDAKKSVLLVVKLLSVIAVVPGYLMGIFILYDKNVVKNTDECRYQLKRFLDDLV